MGMRQPPATLVLGFLSVLAVVSIAIRPASAQSVYVAGALGADIMLASGQESIGLSVPTGGGEALSGAARLACCSQPRWGIELEVSRPARYARPPGPDLFRSRSESRARLFSRKSNSAGASPR